MDKIEINEYQLEEYVLNNFKENALLEISYNRVFLPGRILYIDKQENLTIGLQLKGELLNQVVEIDLNEIKNELIEMRYTIDNNTIILVIK